MTTIYICGVESQKDEKSITDTEKVKSKLKSLKCSVVNPNEIPSVQYGWANTLQSRIEQLKKCQVIYVLPNWKESIMARIELTVAMDLKLHTLFHPTSSKEIKQALTALDN
jgi:hypothetical protein